MNTSPHASRMAPPSPALDLFGTRRLGDFDGEPHRADPADWRDLAPEIVRQRLVIEGVPAGRIDEAQIRHYLSALSREVDMVQLIEPVTHRSDQYGWAGWIHWETSGAHFYAWDEPRLFFSVDLYTCKAFDVDTAVSFTRDFLEAGTLVARSF